MSRAHGLKTLRFKKCSLQQMRKEAECEKDEYLWTDQVILDEGEKFRKYVTRWIEQGGDVSLTAGPIGEEPEDF